MTRHQRFACTAPYSGPVRRICWSSTRRRNRLIPLMALLGVLLSTACGRTNDEPFCRLDAFPDPAIRCREGSAATSHLAWFCEAPITGVALRLGDEGGDLRAEGGPVGDARTGNWLSQDTRFVLLDQETGRLLAEKTVRVETTPCPEN